MAYRKSSDLRPAADSTSPSSRTPMSANLRPVFWAGHPQQTRDALQSILIKASNEESPATTPERILVNACEFRSDIEGGGWHKRVMEKTADKLTVVHYLLTAIGADLLAAEVAKTMGKLSAGMTPESKISYIRYIESRLLAAGALLDQLTADFALRVNRGELVGDPPYGRAKRSEVTNG